MRNTARALVTASAVLAAAYAAPRNIGRALVATSAVLAAAHVAPATRRWPGSWFFPRILRVRADKGVALTFDDGPDQGLDAFLTSWEGEGHVPYSAHRDEIHDQTTNFLYWTLDVTNAAH